MVRRQNADIADTLKLRDVAIATVYGTTLAVRGLCERYNDMRFHTKDG